MEIRTLKLNPDLKHTVRKEVLEWDGKDVHVESWHSLMPNTSMAKLFPNDDTVGFVKEFLLDIPESELI